MSRFSFLPAKPISFPIVLVSLFFLACRLTSSSLESPSEPREQPGYSSPFLLFSQAFVLEPSPEESAQTSFSSRARPAVHSASDVLGDVWLSDEEETLQRWEEEEEEGGQKERRTPVHAIPAGGSSAFSSVYDSGERKHGEEEHQQNRGGVHTPDNPENFEAENVWRERRRGRDVSSSSSFSSSVKHFSSAEPSRDQQATVAPQAGGERASSSSLGVGGGGGDPQPRPYSARVYVHHTHNSTRGSETTSPRREPRRKREDHLAACHAENLRGRKGEEEEEERTREDGGGGVGSSTGRTEPLQENCLRRPSVAVVGEGEEDDSPLQEANQHGFKRKKNRKTIAAFFKSSLSPSASSSSSSSYYASSTNAARSPSSYSPAYDDDEDEDFAADEDAFGDASRGGLTFFKRKLRNALTCPAAKILLGLGGIVALGSLGMRYAQEMLKKRRRRRLAERPPTPFTDLLGHVLLAHEEDERRRSRHSASDSQTEREADLHERRLSSSTIEVSTADVLPNPSASSEGKPFSSSSSKPIVTALYFTGSGVEEMLETRGYLPFTPRLRSIVDGCQEKGEDLRVVYVSADSNVKDASRHFSLMPWYAVPYDDEKGREISQKLYRRFRVSTLPHVVLLNERAEVINPQAYASMLMNPLDFPWKKKTIKELLGDSLILHHEGGERTVSTEEVVKDGKVVGLYFSASWCPPCQSFTPKLVETLKMLKDQQGRGEDLDVIFVSNDKDQSQFVDYFKKMDGFYAIPFADTNRRAMLQEALNVRSLPTLVLIRENSAEEGEKKKEEILTRRGVQAITADREGTNFPWKDREINDVAETVEGLADEPVFILFSEYADEQTQLSQQKELEKAWAALRSQKNDGRYPPLPRLFTAKKLTPRSIALRRICKQDPSAASSSSSAKDSKEQKSTVDPRKPVMAILDLIDQSYYVYNANQDDAHRGEREEEVKKRNDSSSSSYTGTESSVIPSDEIVRFISQFRTEDLERKSLSIPEP